jgi:hypothetical protein
MPARKKTGTTSKRRRPRRTRQSRPTLEESSRQLRVFHERLGRAMPKLDTDDQDAVRDAVRSLPHPDFSALPTSIQQKIRAAEKRK